MGDQIVQGIEKGDVLQKIAGLAFIIGAILLIAGNIAVPRDADPGVVMEVIEDAADNAGGYVEVVFLIIAVGLASVLLGAAGVHRSISTGAAAAWARLGFYSLIAATGLFVVQTGSFGIGLTAVADEWDSMAAGADKDAMFQAFSALYWLLNGTFRVTVVVYWSALLVQFVGIIMSPVYPTWLGWVGLITAAAVVVVGFVYAFADPSKGLDYTVGGLIGLSTIWALAVGVVITRKAW